MLASAKTVPNIKSASANLLMYLKNKVLSGTFFSGLKNNVPEIIKNIGTQKKSVHIIARYIFVCKGFAILVKTPAAV